MASSVMQMDYGVELTQAGRAAMEGVEGLTSGLLPTNPQLSLIQVAMGPGDLWVKSASDAGQQGTLHLDLRTGARLLLDDVGRTAYADPPGAYATRPARETLAPTVTLHPGRSAMRIPGKGLETETCEITLPEGRVEVSFAVEPLGLPGAALSAFRDDLLPFEGLDRFRGRLPVQWVVYQGGLRLMRVRLQEMHAVDIESLPREIPEGYELRGTPPPPAPVEGGLGEFELSERPRATLSRRDLVRLGHQRTRTAGQGVDWTDPTGDIGDELGWVINQPPLEQLRAVINRVCSVFDRFHGDGENGDGSMHVVVDWWQQLEDRLDFEDEEGVMAAFRMIALAYQVMQGVIPEGLTDAERAAYVHGIIAGNALISGLEELLGVEIARYLTFKTLVSDDRLQELEHIAFEQLTDPIEIDLGLDELEQKKIGGIVNIRLWDFDLSVRLPGEGTLERLVHTDDGIEATLCLDRLAARFQFETTPSRSWRSVIAGVFSGGLTAAACTNRGAGYFEVEDARIVLRIASVTEGSRDWLEVSVDRGRSRFDTEMYLPGANLVQSLAALIYSATASWRHLLRSTIFDALDEELTKAVQVAALRWPDVWAAAGGPALRSAGASEGLRSLRASLMRPLSRIPNTTTVDAGRVDALGYALSRRYLTAWLSRLTGLRNATSRRIDVDWEGALGITLPSLEGFPLPEMGEGGYEIARRYETRIVRLPPTVRFPDSGHVDHAGRADLVVDVELRAMLTELQEPTVELPEQDPYYPPGGYVDPNAGIQPGLSDDVTHPSADAHVDPGAMAPMGIPMTGGTTSPWHLRPSLATPWSPPDAHPAGTEIDHCLATVATVRVCMQADLLLGFNARGNLWLPGLRLTVANLRGAPIVGDPVAEVRVRDGLEGPTDEAIIALVLETCEAEIRTLLERAVFSGSDAPRLERPLVPGELAALDVPGELLDMVGFRQAGGGDAFSYRIIGTMLYWPIEIVEHITEHISA